MLINIPNKVSLQRHTFTTLLLSRRPGKRCKEIRRTNRRERNRRLSVQPKMKRYILVTEYNTVKISTKTVKGN